MKRKTATRLEADFSGFQFRQGETVTTPQDVILGVVIARMFIEGMSGGISRAYAVRGYDGTRNMFEAEIKRLTE